MLLECVDSRGPSPRCSTGPCRGPCPWCRVDGVTRRVPRRRGRLLGGRATALWLLEQALFARRKVRALPLVCVETVRSPALGSPPRHGPRVFTAERRASQALFMRNLLESPRAPAARRPFSRPRYASVSTETAPKSGLRPGASSRVVLGSGGAAYKSGLVQARGTVRLPCARVPHHPSGRHRSPEPCGPRRPRGAALTQQDDGTPPTARVGRRRRGRRVPARPDFSS